MKASVVIPSYNSSALIRNCLQAIATQSRAADEIIVVDSSTDDTPSIIRNEFPAVRLHHFEKQTLPGAARNQGLRLATGDIVLFTDTDAEPDRDWIRHHIALHEAHPLVTLFGGAIVNANPGSWMSCLAFWSEFTGYSPREPEAVRAVVPTVNVSLKHKPVLDAGVFMPEDALPGGEDVSFCMLLAQNNLVIRFSPLPIVAHRNRTTWAAYTGHMRSSGRAAGFVAARHPVQHSFMTRLGPLALLAAPPRFLLAAMRVIRREPSRFALLLLLSPLMLVGLTLFMDSYWKGVKTARKEAAG